MKVNLFDQHRWATIQGDGLSIDVLLSPMTHLERIVAAEHFSDSRQVTERTKSPDGAERETVTAVPAVDANSRGIRFTLEHSVNDWKGIEDESGKPIPFSMDNLDRLMGFYPGWGQNLMQKVRELNRLARKDGEKEAPLADPRKGTGGSQPT